MTSVLSPLAVALFALAAATDIWRRRIPNWLCGSLALLGVLRITAALAGGAAILGPGLDVAVAVALFALGAVGFHFRLIGGGDVKLLSAGALWLGAAATAPFLLVTLLSGGLLALLLILGRVASPARWRRAAPPSLPYGVAIAAAGILGTSGSLWT